MIWYKYPETKPVANSSKAMGGCLLQMELPDSYFENVSIEEKEAMFKMVRRIGLFWNDEWCYEWAEVIKPWGPEWKITHYMYFDDIPGPEDLK